MIFRAVRRMFLIVAREPSENLTGSYLVNWVVVRRNEVSGENEVSEEKRDKDQEENNFIYYMDRDAYVTMSIEELNTELTKLRNRKPKLQQFIDELIAYKRENPNDASLLAKLKNQTTLSRRNATTQPNLPHELRQAYRSARQSSASRQSGGKTRKHRKSRRRR